MEISVNQIHNVLRTYRHLIKEKLHQAERRGGKEAEQDNPPIHDPVSISPESIKRLGEDENKHQKLPLPYEK